jgi:hypothetical protein
LVVGGTAIGLGVVGLAVGAAFGARALSLGSQVHAECPKMVCNAQGSAALASGRTAANVADGLLVVGAALAVTGVVLVVVRPGAGKPPVEASVSLAPDHVFLRARY